MKRGRGAGIRRRSRRARDHGTHRWLGWAERLGDRWQDHVRSSWRLRQVWSSGRPTMVLRLAVSRVVVDARRWERHAWSLAPRITLSIAPVLPHATWTRPAQVVVVRPTGVRDPIPGVSAAPEATAARGPDAAAVAGVVPTAAPGVAAWTPLQRVVARAGAPGNADVTVSRVEHESRIVERSTELVRHVRDERRRLEEPRRRPSVVHPQRAPRPEPLREERAAPVTQSPWGPHVGMPSLTRAGGAAALDVARLTEQVVRHIDGRIVAQRERLGRVV